MLACFMPDCIVVVLVAGVLLVLGSFASWPQPFLLHYDNIHILLHIYQLMAWLVTLSVTSCCPFKG